MGSLSIGHCGFGRERLPLLAADSSCWAFKLSEVTRGSEVEAFSYDGGGRTTGIDRGGVERALEWNVDDKLTRVVDDGVEVASYAYDGAGRRVGSTIGGVSKRYLVAPNVGDGYEMLPAELRS